MDTQAATEAPASAPLDTASPEPARPRHLSSVSEAPCLVRVARSAREVESLREHWVALHGDGVQTDIDHFLWALEAEPQVVRPHVLAVERADRVEAIVVARLSEVPLRCRVGPLTLFARKVRAISVLRGGVLGSQDPGVARAVVNALCGAVSRHEADAIVFRQLERGTSLHRAVRTASTLATRQQLAPTDLRWQIDLPATFAEYVGSLSATTRKGIRRTSKRIEHDFGNRITFRVFRDAADLDVYLADAESVAARTYQRGLSVGFVGSGVQRARHELLFGHAWFRGYVLYLDGAPIAFEGGEVYGGRFHSLAAGYDPQYADYRIGAHLLLTAIEDLVADPSVAVFDFGYGDAAYKRRLGHRRLEEGDLVVYARRLRPLSINVVRTAIFAASAAAKSVLGRLGLLEPLRAALRRRASVRGDA